MTHGLNNRLSLALSDRKQEGIFTPVTHDYGLFYNWYAATDERNIAPEGWHVPTSEEWDTLMIYLGGNTVAGGKLKETGNEHWDPPNTGATDEVGFHARGGGNRDSEGSCDFLKEYGAFWTATEAAESSARCVNIAYDSVVIESLETSITQKKDGSSVRLVKDDDTDTGIMTGNDGKSYLTVKIGTQVWLASNLNETRYRNGDLIPEVIDDTEWSELVTGARCYYIEPK